VQIRDLRAVPASHQVIARGLWQHRRAKTILTVGTDCNVGKMTASFELNREFLRRGLRSEFIATGQTGILLSGKGIAVDAAPSDYIAGAIETEIEGRGMSAEYFHVEGQGALTHQGYSAVTAGLLHGVMPDAMILVHHPVRKTDDYGRPLDNLAEMIALYERFVLPFKVSNIAGIAVNSAMMTAAQRHEAVGDIERVTGLPAADVLSPDVVKLADALVEIVRRPQETEKRRTKER
jgi:uncharacterized NAD-dependent epimerase/dehydratase family protein